MSLPLDPADSAPADRFMPRDGAILDLASLEAISAVPGRLLGAWLDALCPGAPGLVLEGLEVEGEASSSGPPGSRRPTPGQPVITVSPGRAVLSAGDGERLLLEIPAPLRAPWPTSAGAAVRGQLVLVPRIIAAKTPGGVTVARDAVGARLGFVRFDQPDRPGQLPLAVSVGNGVDWATDLHRLWQPEHPAMAALQKRLERIEQTVWNAEPEGAVWDRQILGRNWVRYQTVAAAALVATRLDLAGRATSTRDRVRALRALYGHLRRSVDRAATELLQIAGPPEGAGPYRGLDAELLGVTR